MKAALSLDFLSAIEMPPPPSHPILHCDKKTTFAFVTESHVICPANGATFADYEGVDDVTPENSSRWIRELNMRHFGCTGAPKILVGNHDDR
jgi:hypothetical protein